MAALDCAETEENRLDITFDFIHPETMVPMELVFVQMTYFDLDGAYDDADGGYGRECVTVKGPLNGKPSYKLGRGYQFSELTMSTLGEGEEGSSYAECPTAGPLNETAMEFSGTGYYEGEDVGDDFGANLEAQ